MMIVFFLICLVGFQFIVIIALCADRMIYMYAKGDDVCMFPMENRTFDILKWCAALFLPALAVLVKTVLPVWHIPYGDEISTTIMAVDAFLGAILGISHIQYKNGVNNNADN